MKLAAFVLSSIPLLVNFYAKKYLEEDKAQTLTELENDLSLPRIKTYDFIVVGAGTAGCVLASRLSENFTVLLLETGGPPVPASQVPYFTQTVGYDIETNYQFASVPQKFASRRNGGVITTHLGKMLGGSGSHNDMVHNRGSPYDYDNIARIINDPSWEYNASVVEYFKKSENFIGDLISKEFEENYGHDGPVVIDSDKPPILEKWLEAGEELGFKRGDPNGYQTESFTPVNKAIHEGHRSSSYNKHIKPIWGIRENLTVLPYSFTEEVLIDSNLKAYGVAYLRHGIPQIAHASKEVIISGGAFSSPMLLMRSGVGPKDQLEAAEIPVKLDAPEVGRNLNDHVQVFLRGITYNASAVPYIPRMPEDEDFEAMLQNYHESGEGIIGFMQEGPEAFIVSSRAKAEGQSNWPDIQFGFIAMCPAPSGDALPTSCVQVLNSRPKFSGTVELNATAYKNGLHDDMSLALIDFKIFEGESESDTDVLVEAIDYFLKVLNTTTMQGLGAKYAAEPLPECAEHEHLSEAYWRCHITQDSWTTFHSVGTCSLGKVIDTQFRVNGISNMRIADSSVFPVVPNANLNAPVLMVAEKAADAIIRTWS